MIYHIVAVSKNGVIGQGGKLPWHFPADLKYFKNLTTGHTVIMGRKTFDSIGKALPNRQNIVISRHPKPSGVEGVSYATSVEAALEQAKDDEIFIIGGDSIYRETMDLIDGIYLTRIGADYQGDAFYTGVPKGFVRVSSQPLQDNPPIEAALYLRS